MAKENKNCNVDASESVCSGTVSCVSCSESVERLLLTVRVCHGSQKNKARGVSVLCEIHQLDGNCYTKNLVIQ